MAVVAACLIAIWVSPFSKREQVTYFPCVYESYGRMWRILVHIYQQCLFLKLDDKANIALTRLKCLSKQIII